MFLGGTVYLMDNTTGFHCIATFVFIPQSPRALRGEVEEVKSFLNTREACSLSKFLDWYGTGKLSRIDLCALFKKVCIQSIGNAFRLLFYLFFFFLLKFKNIVGKMCVFWFLGRLLYTA